MKQMIPKAFQKHETKFAMFMAWLLCPCLFTLLGFYLGTIFASREHKIDLQNHDMVVGGQYALIFFAVSMAAAIFVTLVIPKVVERDYEQLEEKWAKRGEHHADHH